VTGYIKQNWSRTAQKPHFFAALYGRSSQFRLHRRAARGLRWLLPIIVVMAIGFLIALLGNLDVGLTMFLAAALLWVPAALRALWDEFKHPYGI